MFRFSFWSLGALLLISFLIGTADAQYVQLGTKLVPSGELGEGSQAGQAVALSADGNTVLIGGSLDNRYAGAAWVFMRKGGVWPQQKLVGSGPSNPAAQGTSVALSADGNTALVGGPEAPDGAVWVFVRNGDVWTQQGNKLAVPGLTMGASGAALDGLGQSIALSADGNIALLGAGVGAFVFRRSGGVWNQEEELTVTLPGYNRSVALSADGNTALLGNLTFSYNGSAWSWQASLPGSSNQSAALSSDGSTALLGGRSGDSGFSVGGAVLFHNISGFWETYGTPLVGGGAVGFSMQGTSGALSADGTTALVGGPGDNNSIGAAWLFKFGGAYLNNPGIKLIGSGATGPASRQGQSVALSANGNITLIGGPADGNGLGAAWVFILSRIRDFNGDTVSDALLYDPVLGQSYTALGNGDGTSQYVPNLFTPGFDTLRTGDFNGDGLADLILYNSRTGLAYTGLGNGDGTFNFQPLPWSAGYDIVETGDMDGDGKTDVALYNSTTGTLYTGISDGIGGFTYQYNLVSPSFSFARLADFTGDGKADLFLYSAANGGAYVGVRDGSSGTFTFYPSFVSPGYALADIGDFNADGKTDVILYSPSSGNAALGISDGAGGFTFTPMIFTPGFTSVRFGNYVGDGADDITLYNKNSGLGYFGHNAAHAGCGDIPPLPGCLTDTFVFGPLFWSPGYDYVEPEYVTGGSSSGIILYNSTTGAEYTGIWGPSYGFTYTYSAWGPGKLLAR